MQLVTIKMAFWPEMYWKVGDATLIHKVSLWLHGWRPTRNIFHPSDCTATFKNQNSRALYCDLYQLHGGGRGEAFSIAPEMLRHFILQVRLPKSPSISITCTNWQSPMIAGAFLSTGLYRETRRLARVTSFHSVQVYPKQYRPYAGVNIYFLGELCLPWENLY